VHVVVAVVGMVTTLLLLLLLVVVGAAAAAAEDENGDVIGALCGFQQILTSSVVVRWHIPLVMNLWMISRDHVAVVDRHLILQMLTSHVK